jgi:hypothetical protein
MAIVSSLVKKRNPNEVLLYYMYMNEFVAKKLGEVLAFNRIGTETIEKGRTALVEALGMEKVEDMLEKNRIHGEEVMRVATEAGMIDITLAKADKTMEKLQKMRDLYVGDAWNNATELMEWSGFFEGAAIAHWTLVRGAAEGMNNEGLMVLAEEAVNWHYELLELAESELSSTGQSKAEPRE